MKNYEKDLVILLGNFYFINVILQEVSDLVGIQPIKFESMNKDKQFISTKIGAKEGFQLMVKEKNPTRLLQNTQMETQEFKLWKMEL